MDPESERLLELRHCAVALIRPGQEAGQDRTGQDERQARQEESRPARAEVAKLDGHLPWRSDRG